MAGSEQAAEHAIEAVAELEADPAVVEPALLEQRAEGGDGGTEDFDILAGEGTVGGALEHHGAEEPVAHQHGNGAETWAGFGHQFGMGAGGERRIGIGRRVEDGGALVDRLVHGGGELCHQQHLLAEGGAVRNGRHLGVAPPDSADGDAVAIEGQCQVRRRSERRGGEALLIEGDRQQFEHGGVAGAVGLAGIGSTARGQVAQLGDPPLQQPHRPRRVAGIGDDSGARHAIADDQRIGHGPIATARQPDDASFLPDRHVGKTQQRRIGRAIGRQGGGRLQLAIGVAEHHGAARLGRNHPRLDLQPRTGGSGDIGSLAERHPQRILARRGGRGQRRRYKITGGGGLSHGVLAPRRRSTRAWSVSPFR